MGASSCDGVDSLTMTWTLDTSTPTLDADYAIATLDGWNAETVEYVISATVSIVLNVSRSIQINQNINRVMTWPLT